MFKLNGIDKLIIKKHYKSEAISPTCWDSAQQALFYYYDRWARWGRDHLGYEQNGCFMYLLFVVEKENSRWAVHAEKNHWYYVQRTLCELLTYGYLCGSIDDA